MKASQLGAFAILTVCPAHAASLQFAFGNSSNDTYPTGVDSPAHQENALLTADSTWNVVAGASGTNNAVPDPTGPFVDTQGNAVSSVMMDLGFGTSGSNIGFGSQPLQAGFSDRTGSNEYNNALWGNWLFTNSGNDLAVAITGLAAGDYDIFALSREGNQLARTYNSAIGVVDAATLAGGINFNTTELIQSTGGAAAGSDGYGLNNDYFRSSVTISDPTDSLIVIIDPTNSNFGTIQGLQIVETIPEPSSLLLLGLAGACGLTRRRR